MVDLTADPRLLQPVPLEPLPDRDRFGAPLPAPTRSFVGRQREIAAVGDLLRRDGVRLVTLTGPGGVGKTRLALRVAADLATEFADGAHFVDLSPLTDPDFVLTTIAHALGLRQAGDRPVAEQLAAWLAGSELLLVLDNLERVVDAAPGLAALLAASPEMTILATSRVVLRLSAEHVVPVEPLALSDDSRPRPASDLSSVEAVALFAQRAQAADPGFALSETNAPVVAAIVRQLEGLPLAVELAAARVRHLSLAALLGQLNGRLRILGDGPRDAPARQRTLRDAMGWSYDLLTPAEQTVFRRLGVFAGGCTPAAAAAVAAPASDPQFDVLDSLFALVDHSLLRRAEPTRAGELGEDEPRFRMLETVREFALERLAASGEAEAVRRRHAVFMAEFAEDTAPPWKPPSARAFGRLAAEQDNARSALAWAVERGEAGHGLRVANSFWRLWQIHGHLAEGRRWLEQLLALDAPAPPSLRVSAILGVGNFARSQGDAAGAEVTFHEALALAHTLPPGPELPLVIIHLGDIAHARGDLEAAEGWYREALEQARASGAKDWIFRVLRGLGLVAADRGNGAGAVALIEEAAAICRSTRAPWGLAAMLDLLSELARQQGDRRRAASLVRECLAISRELGIGYMLADCCLAAAEDAAWFQWTERAVRLMGAATALYEKYEGHVPPAGQSRIDATASAARGALGDEAFVAAWAAGQALPLDEMVAEADFVFAAEELSPATEAPLPATTPDLAARSGLSPRELEVVRLLAAGRSNREIADALFVSHTTAVTHVRHILAKLGLDSRAAAAAWAVRHGLA